LENSQPLSPDVNLHVLLHCFGIPNYLFGVLLVVATVEHGGELNRAHCDRFAFFQLLGRVIFCVKIVQIKRSLNSCSIHTHLTAINIAKFEFYFNFLAKL
jgi:hypothetical protein